MTHEKCVTIKSAFQYIVDMHIFASFSEVYFPCILTAFPHNTISTLHVLP